MKWRSSYLTELQKSMRPGAKAELVTARKMFGGKKSIGLGTIAAYRMDPKQRMQRLHYAMACAKWGTLSDAQKNAYSAWAEVNKITLFSAFLHYYLAELKEDLVLYLPMDKITGSTVKDYSKYVNDGTETDCAIQKGEFIDNSLDLNGTTSLVNCGSDPSLNIANEITIAAWIKPGTTGFQMVVSAGTILLSSYCLYQRSTADQMFCLMVNPDGTSRDIKFGNYEEGVWYHIAGTWDGTVSSGYVNGVRYVPGITSYPSAKIFAGVKLGYPLNLPGAPFFNGSIDEARIYKKALSAAEILSAYRQESKWHGDVA